MLRSKSTSAPEMLKFHQRVTCRRQEEITGMSMKDGIRFDPKQWHICMQLEEEGTLGSRTQGSHGWIFIKSGMDLVLKGFDLLGMI
ncbi:hypothetical protein KUCAC02_007207 [Chaenocephalus aceratus]|uniref:Uncharacterized protein n=1 Tax=Chaenocephalus aceratus TaxID=36190 RepID=A0ACB9X6K5_CHAAC|nr:hypothetical protein KUCAC02_007207 [Chaenocephalus aceratus]